MPRHGKCVAFRLISIVAFGGQNRRTEDCMLWLCCKLSPFPPTEALWHCDISWFYCGDVSAEVVYCVCELCDISWFYCGDVSPDVVYCVCELWHKLVLLWGSFGRSCMLCMWIVWHKLVLLWGRFGRSCRLCMWLVWHKLVLLWGRFGRSCILGMWLNCRSQWARSLRRRSAVVRLLRWWVWIPLVAWMFVVGVVCCQVEVSATSWSLLQRSPADCGASLCVI
jgi:hypothetical protein